MSKRVVYPSVTALLVIPFLTGMVSCARHVARDCPRRAEVLMESGLRAVRALLNSLAGLMPSALLALFLFFPYTVGAQTATLPDSLAGAERQSVRQPSLTNSLPALGLVATGAVGLCKPANKYKLEVRDAMRGLSNQKRFPLDDYVQYLSGAAALTLEWAGVAPKHDIADRALLTGTAYASTASITLLLKNTVTSVRPGVYDYYKDVDTRSRINPTTRPRYFNSFPSGHTATAFTGAELVRLEYGDDCPWAAVGAYVVATGVGFLRVYNEQHWFTDVLAGAGVGILSARIGWWLLPYEKRVIRFLSTDRHADSSAGGEKEVSLYPSSIGSQPAMAFSLTF